METHWINDAGAVTGHAANPDNSMHAFFWKKGLMTDLGTVDGEDCSSGFSVNLANHIVGVSFACDSSVQHAFLWENGKIIDLNRLIPAGSDMQLQVANSINNRGEIVGVGVLPNGDGHGFLLVPCDDKHAGGVGCDYSVMEAGITASRADKTRNAWGQAAYRAMATAAFLFPACSWSND